MLDLEPDLSGGEIARRIAVMPQSVSELVAALAELGLVAREASSGRGHRIPVGLTAAGQDVLRRASGVIEAVNSPAALGLTPAEACTSNLLLHKVIGAG